MELLLVPLGCALAGLAIGRWIALLLPVIVWAGIATFLILNDGWYGHGWGDNGIALNAIAAILSVLATAAGIGVRQALRRPSQATD